jgi:hypothetical protein
MPFFSYNRWASCVRAWPQSFSLTIADVTLEGQPVANRPPFVGWPIVVSCEFEAKNGADALKKGSDRCASAIDAAVLLIGYEIELGAEELHSLDEANDPPVIIFSGTKLRYRPTPATGSEQRELHRQAAMIQLPQSETIRHAMRWYAESVRETDVVDKYVKLFVTLDMFVPRNPQRGRREGFAKRGADVLISQFTTVEKHQICGCLRNLADIRNDLFHEGLESKDISAAAQILEKIVRAMLRRHIGLESEFEESDLFRKAEGYTEERLGGPFGWPQPVDKPKP